MARDVRIRTELVRDAIDVARRTAALGEASAGAVVTFSGVVRDRHDGRAVEGIAYTAYDAMARRELRAVAEEAARRWPLCAVDVTHRVGDLVVGDVALFVGASGAHRAEAFDAVRWIVDAVKRRVPVWKHERYRDGTGRWL